MRVERTGGPPGLQAHFTEFVLKRLNGRSLDDDAPAESAQGKLPDFSCFRDIMLIEMKHLEVDQADRLNATYQNHVAPEEHPFFFGRRSVDLDKLSNAEEVKRAILSRLAKTLETLLRKANSQFCEYRERHTTKNAVNICVLLNAALTEFSPEIVLRSVHQKMRGADGSPRYDHIDAVVYISEKHFQILPDGRLAFAIAIFEHLGVMNHPWKRELLEKLVESWSEYRTGGPSVHQRRHEAQFGSIEDIPSRMRQSDAWRLAYRRNPYLKGLTDRQLKVHFQRCIGQSSINFIRGDWEKLPLEQQTAASRGFSDAIEEINSRQLDMREFDPRLLSDDELREAHAGLPHELQEILSGRAR
jgi:hypothetical protein